MFSAWSGSTPTFKYLPLTDGGATFGDEPQILVIVELIEDECLSIVLMSYPTQVDVFIKGLFIYPLTGIGRGEEDGGRKSSHYALRVWLVISQTFSSRSRGSTCHSVAIKFLSGYPSYGRQSFSFIKD
jgi:hypothetical protein